MMRFERQDYIDLAKFVPRMLGAMARGVGRIAVEQIEKFVGDEPELSIDEWRRFDEAEKFQKAREFNEAFQEPHE